MFTNSKVGDDVWSNNHGWGYITLLEKDWFGTEFIHVKYHYHTWSDVYYKRTSESRFGKGKLFHNDLSLPPDEYTVKTKLNIPVDTPMIVKSLWGSDKPQKRHFSHFDNHTGVWCFGMGTTSFTSEKCLLEHYDYWDIIHNNLIYI